MAGLPLWLAPRWRQTAAQLRLSSALGARAGRQAGRQAHHPRRSPPLGSHQRAARCWHARASQQQGAAPAAPPYPIAATLPNVVQRQIALQQHYLCCGCWQSNTRLSKGSINNPSPAAVSGSAALAARHCGRAAAPGRHTARSPLPGPGTRLTGRRRRLPCGRALPPAACICSTCRAVISHSHTVSPASSWR
jgi:hypothetical protein